jgi:hypothetical protein
VCLIAAFLSNDSDLRKLFPISPFSESYMHTPRSFPELARYLLSSLRARVKTSSQFSGASAIVAVSLPLPFPGRNLGKVASLAPLCKPPFKLTMDSFFQEVKGSASLETTVGILWRRTSPAWCRFNSSKGATLVAVRIRNYRRKQPNDDMPTTGTATD